MIFAVQLLLLCLFCEAYAQHRNQPTQAPQRGINYGGYPPATEFYPGEYNVYAFNPAPYLGYGSARQFNTRKFGTPQDVSAILRNGIYGYQQSHGVYLPMNHADAMQTFRATLGAVGANYQGTIPAVGRISAFNDLPAILPPATGSSEGAAAVAYGPRAVVPYGGHDRSTPDPYALAARSFEYSQYGRFGYGSIQAAPGGPSYGNFPPSVPAGFTASFTPGVTEPMPAYGNQPSVHQGFRRR
ncbi:hypothetical protein MRX96_008640 [Rhipicephalus microplus]|uniref:uncharacterized protein LOC142768774 n=1 Tax=Rhipicephalus microplus TaxID=6941 RepID=UPI003F6CCC47